MCNESSILGFLVKWKSCSTSCKSGHSNNKQLPFFFLFFTAAWQSITGNKTPLWFQGAAENASLAWTHLDMDRWVSASPSPGVMEPTDGWDMVTLPWVMNMKPFTVSSCHVTKRSLGLWECRAYSLCQDKQRPLNSWGTAAGTWLDKNKNNEHAAQHAG